jgi:cysteine desulfurase / selenocysteine lyase
MSKAIHEIRAAFPGISRNTAYLDNAATTQMHVLAIEAMQKYWHQGRANVGRGLYPLAENTMRSYESARSSIASMVGATSEQCVFTKSVTEGLNMAAYGLRSIVGPGDEILISPFEHHANILPWRRIAKERGAIVRVMPMTNQCELDVPGAVATMNRRTKIVSMTLVSNVLGTILPVARIADAAHRVGATVVVDAAQAVAHLSVSMADLGADAIVYGAHKMYGPMGTAAVVMTPRLIQELEPMILGGGMVDEVRDEAESWREGVQKFEGGSPNVEGVIGWGAVCEGSREWEIGNRKREEELRKYLIDGLRSIEHIRVFDPAEAVGIVAFVIDNAHPHDVAQLLGEQGVCVRAGHHCAAPLVRRLSETGVLRASLGVYNDEQDVDRLLDTLPSMITSLRSI